MLINNIMDVNLSDIATDGTGSISYTNEKSATIKLGEYKLKSKYGYVEINLGICEIRYERYRSTTDLPYKYWFKSQLHCDRFHGLIQDDIGWVLDHFREVTPYTDEINDLIERTIRKLFSKADSFMAGDKEEEAV